MRLPRLYRLTELGDDRLAVWMENVAALDDAWEPPRFARAARALGGLAARRSDPALLAATFRERAALTRVIADLALALP